MSTRPSPEYVSSDPEAVGIVRQEALWSEGDLEILTAATGELAIKPRGHRWTHLTLCVLDAVFSINARYSSVVGVCHRYAAHEGLGEPRLPPAHAEKIVGTEREQPVGALAELGQRLSPETFAAEVLLNRGRTSTRNGILKADAVIRYAEILSSTGVHRLGDVAALLTDTGRLATVEDQLRFVPGHGGGARLSYLWMLAGDDHDVKPDRMILRWLGRHLGRTVTVSEARSLLIELAEHLACTPWELDHAVWHRESGRT